MKNCPLLTQKQRFFEKFCKKIPFFSILGIELFICSIYNVFILKNNLTKRRLL